MNPDTAELESVPTLDSIAKNTPTPEHAQATSWTVSVLRRAMNDGALVPGSKLSEQTIADKLNISRNTLRQAFMLLSAQNLVEQIPNRGVFVKAPDAKQIREMFAMRLALEATAIELASVGEQPSMRSIVERAKIARAAESGARMALANQDFHRALVGLARSSRFDQQMDSILAEMRLLFYSVDSPASFHARYIEYNEQILDYIEEGKKTQAMEAIRDYLNLSRDQFSDEIEGISNE